MATAQSVLNLNGLSNEEILKYCPSVFAEQKHESRSARYTYIPTSQILAVLAKETGYVPTKVQQSGSRIEGKAEYTKHLVTLTHQDHLGTALTERHQILLENSHDGTSGYVVRDGIFRLVCTNGLIRGDILNTFKVYHKGGDSIIGEVVESTLALGKQSEQVMDTVQEMKTTELSRPEQLLLSELAMRGRFDEDEEEQDDKTRAIDLYKPQDFLAPRRYEDRADDAFTTMNVIEENLRKGGQTRRDYRNRGKKRTTRETTDIGNLTKMETLLWELTQRMVQIKQQG